MSNNKTKILYLITQSELGGAQKYVLDLSMAIKNEFDITVAYGEQGNDGELAKILKQENINTYSLPHLKRAINPYYDLHALFEIKNLIKKIQPDIIHLNSSKISILGSLAKISIRGIFNLRSFSEGGHIHSQIHIIYTVHGWVFNEPLRLWKKLFYKYAEKISARFKDKLICVSNYDETIARTERLCPPNKLITIHNGIKPINFLSQKEAINIINKKQSAIRNPQSAIVTIANLYPTKGLEFLVQSIADLRGHYKTKTSLTIIGEGPERKKLEKLINTLRLTDQVNLAGRMDGAKYLKAFDYYVCSSVKEGLSYTIMEAMQAGLPIVATKVGGNPELIKNHESGLLVKPHNPDEIARALNRLINEPELAKKLGKSAHHRAIENFTLNKMVSNTKSLYQNLLKK